MRPAEGLPTLIIARDREKASGGVRKVVSLRRGKFDLKVVDAAK
jgi:hypothetical protein